MDPSFEIEILPQPDEAACGPTCLHAVYRYFGEPQPLDQLISEVSPLAEGGTLGVDLGCHALRRGWEATLITYNLVVFDPTWFRSEVDLAAKLREQREAKLDPKLRRATRSYLEFLELGGRIETAELGPDLLARLLADGPVVTGLSATYLYDCARERGHDPLVSDDVGGVSTGHFVVLVSYRPQDRQVVVADPLRDRPGFESHLYTVGVDRAVGAILLGILTYDANLAVLRPKRAPTRP